MAGELERSRKPAWEGTKAQRAELRMKVWDLRKNGYTFREIEAALGISRSFAATLETEELDNIPAKARDTYREHMEERLGQMQRHVVELFAQTKDWNAFKGYQWTEERLARLLGLDAPTETKAEVVTRDGVDVDLATLMEEAQEKWGDGEYDPRT